MLILAFDTERPVVTAIWRSSWPMLALSRAGRDLSSGECRPGGGAVLNGTEDGDGSRESSECAAISWLAVDCGLDGVRYVALLMRFMVHVINVLAAWEPVAREKNLWPERDRSH